MNFLKKLFSSKNNSDNKESNFTGVYSEEYFKKRYTEEHLDESDSILDGCLKMIQSYFIDNKIEQKVTTPINHPENLDQVLDDGIGFHMYCKAFQLQDTQIAMFLAYAFSDFLIKAFDFKLYKDNEPEFPLRKMTLKYDKDQLVLSIYPFEYAVKALRGEVSFQNLFNRIGDKMGALPSTEELLKKYTGVNFTPGKKP